MQSYCSTLLWTAQQRAALLADPEALMYTAALDALCPPRAVRAFRVVRFHDAWPTRRACRRSVQFTVWDPPAEVVFEPGACYRVTALTPIQRRAWRPPEAEADIFLASTAQTRWTSLAP